MSYNKQQNQNKQEKVIEKPVLEISFDEIEEIRRQAVENVKNKRHEWRQKGPWMECRSCDYPHGYFIGMDKTLKGIDEDGNPFFEYRGKE